MDYTDKVHLGLMTDMSAVDDVLSDIEPVGYTLKLVKIPCYIWIYDQEGVGEDVIICMLKTDESPRVVEAEWVEYREMIEKQQRNVDYEGTDKTGYLELEDKYGPGIAFTAYLRGKRINAELIEPVEIVGW